MSLGATLGGIEDLVAAGETPVANATLGLRLLCFLGGSRHPAPDEVASVVPGVLVEVALVILLGAPEVGRRDDLGNDLAVEELLRLFL